MAISFNEIPIFLRTPGSYVEIDNTKAVQGVAVQPHVALICGQKLSTGTGTEETILACRSADHAADLAGKHSMVEHMVQAYKNIDPLTELFVVLMDDAGAAVQATGTFTIAGTVTEAGELVVYVAGARASVAVAVGDVAADVATALAVAIGSIGAIAGGVLPITVSPAAGVVTCTARHGGTLGNEIDLRDNALPGDRTPAGLTITTVGMTSGATDPAAADCIAAWADTQFHTIVWPWLDATSLTALEAELLTRWGALVQKEGMAFGAKHGTQSELTTFGNTRNSFNVCCMGAGDAMTTPWEIASMTAARDARQTQIDPARSRQTLPLTGMTPPAPSDRFTRAERDILLSDGVSTFIVDNGGNALVERLITMYQTNAQGIVDFSYWNVATVRLVAALRYSVRARISSKFPRHKLVGDETEIPPGQAMVNPKTIRGELIALFTEWQDLGWCENIDQFKEELLVERNSTDPDRVDAILPPDLVNNFRVFAASLQFKVT